MPKSETYNQDCLAYMQTLPDKAFSLAIVDPPYGISINRSAKLIGTSTQNSRKATNKVWDDAIPTKEYFLELFRISENQIIFGANYFWEFLYSSQCYLIWDKRGYLPDVPFADTEFAWTSFVSKPSKRYVVINHGFIKDEKDLVFHPCQKPRKLYELILKDFAKQGDTIFDSHLGSGSSRIAAYDLGFDFVGCELDTDYFTAQEKRFAEHIAQPKLFEPEIEQMKQVAFIKRIFEN